MTRSRPGETYDDRGTAPGRLTPHLRFRWNSHHRGRVHRRTGYCFVELRTPPGSGAFQWCQGCRGNYPAIVISIPHQGRALTPPGSGANPTRVGRISPPGSGAYVSGTRPESRQDRCLLEMRAPIDRKLLPSKLYVKHLAIFCCSSNQRMGL